MKLETARLVALAAEDLGTDVEVRERYSGRGMYGRQTAALVATSFVAVLQAAAAAAGQLAQDDPRALDDFVADLDVRTDSMGLGVVVY